MQAGSMDCQPCLITVPKGQWLPPGVDPRGNTDIYVSKTPAHCIYLWLECSPIGDLQSNIPVIAGLLQVLPEFQRPRRHFLQSLTALFISLFKASQGSSV